MTVPTRPGNSAASARKVHSRPGSPLPRTARRWPARTMSCGGDPGEQIDPLLPGQPAHQHQQRRAVGMQAEAGFERGAVHGAALQLAGGEGRGEQRVGLGVPHLGVDAVDDAVQRPGAGGDQPVEAHAEVRGLDLLGIGRADGGDRARVGEAGLQVADAAEELDPVEARGLRRQLERGEDAGGKAALEGDVVDRHHRRPRHAVEAQVGGREARLPVVRVHEIGQELRHHPHGDVGRGAAERAEAAPVVRVVGAARVAIGTAGAVVERRAVDDDELEPLDLGGEEPRRHAEQRRIVIDDAGGP